MKAFGTIIAAQGTASAMDGLMELKYMNCFTKFCKNIESIEEYATRLVYFSTLDKYIKEHNSSKITSLLAIISSLIGPKEYSALMGSRPDPNVVMTYKHFDENNSNMTVDWRHAGAVRDPCQGSRQLRLMLGILGHWCS